jgi:hypothetical protein
MPCINGLHMQHTSEPGAAQGDTIAADCCQSSTCCVFAAAAQRSVAVNTAASNTYPLRICQSMLQVI